MSHWEACARKNSLVSECRRECEGKAGEQATAVVPRRWGSEEGRSWGEVRKGGPE